MVDYRRQMRDIEPNRTRGHPRRASARLGKHNGDRLASALAHQRVRNDRLRERRDRLTG
jgi:hypothetical protein